MLVLSLLGCVAATGSSGIPLQVSVTATLPDGSEGSLLVEFVAPEKPPNLLFAEGAFEVETVYGRESQGLPLSIPGPGRGFSVVEGDGGVMLNLPHRERGVPLFAKGSQVTAVSWFDELPEERRAEVGERFRALERIRVTAKNSRIDADLEDWRGTPTHGIDTPEHLESGQENWSGPRDSSIGVAAHLHHGRLDLAVRVRDEEVLVGVDALEVELDGRSWRFPIGEKGVQSLDGGVEIAFTDQVSFGVGAELSIPMPTPGPAIEEVVLLVRYHDSDSLADDATPSVLASAPSLRALEMTLAGQ